MKKVDLVTNENKLRIYHMTRDQIDAAHLDALTRIAELEAIAKEYALKNGVQSSRIAELEAQLAFETALTAESDRRNDSLLTLLAELESKLDAVPKWQYLTLENHPENDVYAIWIRRPISGDVLAHYLDMGFQWAPYDTPPQVES